MTEYSGCEDREWLLLLGKGEKAVRKGFREQGTWN